MSFRDLAVPIAVLMQLLSTITTAQNLPARDDIFKIGHEVSAPTVILKVEPRYSKEAREAAIQGTIVIAGSSGCGGQAERLSVIRSLGYGLDEMALEAINQWIFKPGVHKGTPVAVQATIEVNFRLEEPSAVNDRESYKKFLAEQIAAHDPSWEGSDLMMRAEADDASGNTQRALDEFNQALFLFRGAKDKNSEIRALEHFVAVAEARGDRLQAIDLYDQALAVVTEDKTEHNKAFSGLISNVPLAK